MVPSSGFGSDLHPGVGDKKTQICLLEPITGCNIIKKLFFCVIISINCTFRLSFNHLSFRFRVKVKSKSKPALSGDMRLYDCYNLIFCQLGSKFICLEEKKKKTPHMLRTKTD